MEDRHAAYGWMVDTLRQFGYGRCTRADKGVLRQYLLKVTGLSRAQVARCIAQFADDGRIKDRRRAPAVPFVRRYTAEDIRPWPRTRRFNRRSVREQARSYAVKKLDTSIGVNLNPRKIVGVSLTPKRAE